MAIEEELPEGWKEHRIDELARIELKSIDHALERIKNGIPIDEFRYKEYLEISNLFSNCLIND